MSLKVSTFKTLTPAPQVLSNFVVLIPSLISSPFNVQSASIPSERFDEASIPVNGQNVYLPTRSQVPGEWTCVVAESVLNLVGLNIRLFQELSLSTISYSDPDSARIPVPRLMDIYVALLDSSTGYVPVRIVTLKHSWLKSVQEISLDAAKATDALLWTMSFRYQWVSKVL